MLEKFTQNMTQKGLPQFHTPPLSSTHQFHTKEPLLFSPEILRSTPKTRQFNTPLSSTPKPLSSTHWFWSWTEEFSVWNWGIFGVELRDFGVELKNFAVELNVFSVDLRGEGSGTEGF